MGRRVSTAGPLSAVHRAHLEVEHFRVRRPLAELRERRGAGLSTTPHPVTDTRNTAVVAAAISGASSTTTAVIKEDQPGRG